MRFKKCVHRMSTTTTTTLLSTLTVWTLVGTISVGITCSSSMHHLASQEFPPCNFNPLCTCSKSYPDLGRVVCHSVPLPVIPRTINQSTIYVLKLDTNGLRYVEEKSFYGSGILGLQISSNLIRTLKAKVFAGLERSLRDLNLERNQLNAIPTEALSRLTRLKSLNLNLNQIKEIQSSTDFPPNLMSSLRSLHLAGNRINFLNSYAFKYLFSLESLDLSSNRINFIHELAFSQQPIQFGSTSASSSPSVDPHSLEVRGRGKSNLDAQLSTLVNTNAATHSLISINLNDNRLKRVPYESIKNLTKLKFLHLDENLIETTTDPIFKEKRFILEELHLASNGLRELTTSSFENFFLINRTYLSNNEISELLDSPFNQIKVNSIYLDGCQIKSVSPHFWTGLESGLKVLDLSHNQLVSGPKNSAILYNDTFNNLDSLKSFSLNYNGFKYRLSPLSLASSQESLQELSLKSPPSGIKSAFSPIKYEMHFASVRRLGLSKLKEPGQLTKSDLLGFGGHNLEHLDVSDADIEQISPDTFNVAPSIRLLNLSQNYLSGLSSEVFRPLSRSLITLDMSGSLKGPQLDCEIFTHLHSLQILILTDNDLNSLSSPSNCWTPLKKLKRIHFDFNLLTRLDQNLFKSVSSSSLSHIFLSYNHLEAILEETFVDMESLIHLDLSYNLIVTIKTQAFLNLNCLENLNLEGNEIRIVEEEAFANLPKLRLLNLSYNKLIQLDLNVLDQVGTLASFHLDFGSNQISDFHHPNSVRLIDPFSSAEVDDHHFSSSSPESVDLSHNNLNRINSSHFDSVRNTLVILNLSYNRLSFIDSKSVSKFRQIQKLFLNNNQIRSLSSNSFEEEPNLQILDISVNLISELPLKLLSENHNLRFLNLSRNQIRVLPELIFGQSPNLEVLDVSNNRLTVFPYNALKSISNSLRELHCANNQLEYIRSYDLKNLFHHLLVLNLANNQIKQLSLNLFNGLSNLISLDLSRNPLNEIEDRTFDCLSSNLQELNLSQTRIKVVPTLILNRLIKLDLSSNQISFIHSTSVRNLSGLESLNLSNNSFASVPNNLWHLLPHLRHLDLSSNLIQSLSNDSFIGLDKLESLNVQNLSLSYIQYGALKPIHSLISLDISYYQSIKGFSILNLIADNSGLETLNLDANQETRLSKSMLIGGPTLQQQQLQFLQPQSKQDQQSPPPLLPRKLKQLSVRGNRIEFIEDDFLTNWGSQSLRLALKGTKLSSLLINFFANLGKTRNLWLDLRQNSFTTIGDILYAIPAFSKSGTLNLHSAFLSSNPWTCDCNLAWIRDWYKQIQNEFTELTLELRVAHSKGISSTSYTNSTIDQLDARLDSIRAIVQDLRETRCLTSQKTLLDVFRQDLRGCKRGRSNGGTTGWQSTSKTLTVAQIVSIIYVFFSLISLWTLQ